MEATYQQLDEDEERFRKLQTSDQANFSDRLDTLQVIQILFVMVITYMRSTLKFCIKYMIDLNGPK